MGRARVIGIFLVLVLAMTIVAQTPPEKVDLDAIYKIKDEGLNPKSAFAIRQLQFELQLHPVMRQSYVSRQAGIGRFMCKVVANMCKERALRLKPIHNRQRTLHRGVCGMRLVAQRIQKENVQAV